MFNDGVRCEQLGVRIIPRLDIKAPNLVKGVHLEGLRVLGQPWNFARHYYEQGADELLYMDVVASLFQRGSIKEIVERTAREIFIPLTVGGGLRSLDDIFAVLRSGADKVSLNTAAVSNPQLIREAARRFGSSTIVVSIEAKKQPDGRYEAYVDNGRERSGVEVLSWAKKVADLGAGEIIITSIDREGTGRGFDLELTQRVTESVPIPVIACGGAGRMGDVHAVLTQGRADAVSLSSLLHYNYTKLRVQGGANADPRVPPGLRSGQYGSSKIEDASLHELKCFLSAQGIDCRHGEQAAPHV